jgi:thiamine-phosphate pyrophosphorylase
MAVEGPSVEPDEIGQRLFLFGEGEDLAGRLPVLLGLLQPAGFCLRATGRPPADLAELRRLCTAAGTAFLIEDDLALALEAGADGLHLAGAAGAEGVAAARRALGPEKIIGCACGGSRHAAMLAGEEGADYVSLAAGDPDELAELIDWWQDLFVLPCMALAEDLEAVGRLTAAGTDFVALDRVIFAAGNDDPAAAAEQVARAFREALA